MFYDFNLFTNINLLPGNTIIDLKAIIEIGGKLWVID